MVTRVTIFPSYIVCKSFQLLSYNFSKILTNISCTLYLKSKIVSIDLFYCFALHISKFKVTRVRYGNTRYNLSCHIVDVISVTNSQIYQPFSCTSYLKSKTRAVHLFIYLFCQSSTYGSFHEVEEQMVTYRPKIQVSLILKKDSHLDS